MGLSGEPLFLSAVIWEYELGLSKKMFFPPLWSALSLLCLLHFQFSINSQDVTRQRFVQNTL